MPFYKEMIIVRISLLERGQEAWCTYVTLLLRPEWNLRPAEAFFYRLGTLDGGLLHENFLRVLKVALLNFLKQ